MPLVKILYTDLDGTLVHYEGFEDAESARLVALPPSPTGRVGAISRGTLERFAALRPPRPGQPCEWCGHGDDPPPARVRLVVLTGARTSTLFQRLPFLPAADAYVSENGGRIFYPPEVAEELGEYIAPTARGSDGGDEAGGSSGAPKAEYWEDEQGPATAEPLPGTAYPLVEDLSWRAALQGVCGLASEEARGVPPERRTGPLWALYRRLASGGWRVDANGFATAFRVQEADGAAVKAEDAGVAVKAEGAGVAVKAEGGDSGGATAPPRPPPGIACCSSSTDPGVLLMYPAIAGKEGAAARLRRLFKAEAEASYTDYLEWKKEFKKRGVLRCGARKSGSACQPCPLPSPARVAEAFLCDGDDDLALAAQVDRALVPTFGSASVEAAVRADHKRAAEAGAPPRRFVVPPWLEVKEEEEDACKEAEGRSDRERTLAAAASQAPGGRSAAARCAAATELMLEEVAAWVGEADAAHEEAMRKQSGGKRAKRRERALERELERSRDDDSLRLWKADAWLELRGYKKDEDDEEAERARCDRRC